MASKNPGKKFKLERLEDRIAPSAFGGCGETIDGPEQVAPAIERAFASAMPYCINVKIRGARSPFTDIGLNAPPGVPRLPNADASMWSAALDRRYT